MKMVEGDMYLDEDYLKPYGSIFVDNGDILPAMTTRYSIGADYTIVADNIKVKRISAWTIKALKIDATDDIDCWNLIVGDVQADELKCARILAGNIKARKVNAQFIECASIEAEKIKAEIIITGKKPVTSDLECNLLIFQGKVIPHLDTAAESKKE